MNYLSRSYMQGRSWWTHFSVLHLCPALRVSKWYNHVNVSSSSGASGSNSRYVALIQPPILASIAYLDMNANIWELGVWRIHLIWCTWRFLNHNTELASTIYIWTADTVGLCPGTPRTASSWTACYVVALFSCSSLKLRSVFPLRCFCLHSATSLHQHGTYGQPGEKSQFTEESRCTPWASTGTCIQGEHQLWLQIKCLNSNLRV